MKTAGGEFFAFSKVEKSPTAARGMLFGEPG